MIALTVRDTGLGIAAVRLRNVFEPFGQASRATTKHLDGTGLSLAISRDLARAMGGDLYAESVPGEGSTFTLELRSTATRAMTMPEVAKDDTAAIQLPVTAPASIPVQPAASS